MSVATLIEVKVTQSCLTLCYMACTVHGILQARILEWVAFPFSRGSSQPRDLTQSPTLQADSLPAEQQRKPNRNRWFVKIIISRSFYALGLIVTCMLETEYHGQTSRKKQVYSLAEQNVLYLHIQ